LDPAWGEDNKPGFIVDGQQRLAAVRDAEVEIFPLCVTAFITDDLKQQTEQFILVNSTKPLPKGLIYELLPNTVAPLSSALSKRRFPSEVLSLLNHESQSPMRGLIQTPTTPQGMIKDNSVLRMLENSLSEGLLYRYRGNGTRERDPEAIFKGLCAYWSAVREVFHDAWGKPPKKSRLMHGAGILSMGYVMDAIGDRHRTRRMLSADMFANDLAPLKSVCRWTDG
jgi:DGQHR domain-containing protein